MLDAAVAAAMRHPRGPVYMDVPADVLGHEAVTPLAAGPWFEPLPTEADLDAAAAVLADARVVIWAGGGAVDAEPSVAVLAEHLGAPVVASFGGRGVPPTAHPLTVGLPPHEPEVAELIGRADVLLAVGGDLDGMNTRNWTMPRPPRLVTLDPAPLVDPPEWAADATVTGRLGDALRGLRDRLPTRAPWAPPSLGEQARDRLAADPVSAEAMALVAAVEAARTDETVLVCDMAVAGYWVGGYASAPGPRRLAYPVGWGTLGFGLPAAIGPAAAGHPVIAVCGDGGLAMGVGELATLVQERLPVTVLVVDDGGYGMLRYDQARVGDPEVGVDLVGPDLSALAAAYGLPATAVPSVGDGLASALAKAVGVRRTTPRARARPAHPAAHHLAALARRLTLTCDAEHIVRCTIAIYRDGTRADTGYRLLSSKETHHDCQQPPFRSAPGPVAQARPPAAVRSGLHGHRRSAAAPAVRRSRRRRAARPPRQAATPRRTALRSGLRPGHAARLRPPLRRTARPGPSHRPR